jgi:hypothetical protein
VSSHVGIFGSRPQAAVTSIYTNFLNAYDGDTLIGSYSAGSLMPDWTRALGNAGAPSSNQVIAMAGTISGQAFRMVGSSGINSGAYYTWNYIAARQDSEILMSVYMDNNIAAPISVGATLQRFQSTATYLGVGATIVQGQCPVVGVNNGGKSYTTATWYWLRHKTSGSTAWGKFWQRGTPEPLSWDVTAPTGTPQTGLVGITFNYRTGITLRSDWFSVSTDGTPAYGPV